MFRTEATAGQARAGWLETPRGRVLTPCFMPVGSRGVVRLLSAQDLDDLGVQVVLANTYHLMLRPGAEVVAAMGGLHGFTGWDGHFLTDSGGYQVMSLPCSVDDDGVTFRSSYDGSWAAPHPRERGGPPGAAGCGHPDGAGRLHRAAGAPGGSDGRRGSGHWPGRAGQRRPIPGPGSCSLAYPRAAPSPTCGPSTPAGW